MTTDYNAKPKNVKNFTTSSEVNLDQSFQDYSEFLPAINRTESLQRFFGATVNQLLSSGSTQSIDAYWGRLQGRNYNPENELFQPESSANRINYQFQPGVVRRVAGEAEQTTSYINWLDRLGSLGADLDNHDRLFSEPGYVLDLPINADMFVNYRNYFWLEGEMPLIEIEATITNPIDIDNIVARSQYTTPDLGNYKTVEFVTGLRVKFKGSHISSTSGTYNVDSIYYVENVGGRHGIKLVEITSANGNNLFPETVPYRIELRAGWDTEVWDRNLWDGTSKFEEYDISTSMEREDINLNKSYIVMERWASDKNPWARSNKWFSKHALRIATEYNNLNLEAYLNVRTRADRPIVEFNANMELYNSCKNFVETVDYVISMDEATSLASGVSEFFADSENAVQNNDIILVARDTAGLYPDDFNNDFNADFGGTPPDGPFGSSFSSAFYNGDQAALYEHAFRVNGVGSSITLTPYNIYGEDQYVIVAKGTEKGAIYCFINGDWGLAQNKETRGDAPLFRLYNEANQYLGGFANNNFLGDKVFGYKVSQTGQFDRELGFAPAFVNQGSFANYQFEWTLSNQRYNKNATVSTSEEIPGYYFFRNWVEDEYYNGWSNIREGQRVPVIQTIVHDGVSAVSFELGTTAIGRTTEYTVTLENGSLRWHDHSYIDRNSVGYANPDFVWKYDTDYTINDLISVDASKLEMTDPFGGTDANISYTGSDVLKTLNVDSAYQYDKVLYRKSDEPAVYGEIFLSNSNQNRYLVMKNGQQLVDGVDFTFAGTTITITADVIENDVIELSYVPDLDLANAVYDVAPVHFYNNDNDVFDGAGYDDLINHFIRQISALPGFEGRVNGDNNYHRILRQHTFDGLIRQQIFRTKNVQYLLDQEDINPIRALKTFSNDYSDFKRQFRNKVAQLWRTEAWHTVRDLVDRALHDINLGKNETFKYAHSDMLYYKQSRSVTYVVNDATTTFALPELVNRYDDTQNHVQVYLTETVDGTVVERPLTKNIDYTINGPNIILTTATQSGNIAARLNNIAASLNNTVVNIGDDGDPTAGAIVVVRWYDYAQLSNVPFSAVKLGFFKPTQVEIVNGELIGHDGSRHILTGTNLFDLDSVDFDPVAAASWDLELRVFNNLVDAHFVDSNMGLDMKDFYPNPVSNFSYTVRDINSRLDDWYNRYAVRNKIVEIDTVAYDAADQFTWNYSTVGPLLGSWRSLYVYEFGTDRPHTHPWEMLGHGVKPTWWDANYSWTTGASRTALLRALQYGITGNATTAAHVDIRYARSNFAWSSNVLVTGDGNATLNGPVTANVVVEPANVNKARDFVFGDWSEIENTWRKSSEYMFALAEVYLQLKPYRTHESFWQLDRWNVNRAATQEQWTDVDTHQRTHISEIHNQTITTGIVSKIIVVQGGTGYTGLDLDFEADSGINRKPAALAYTNAGKVVAVAVTDPGRGFDNDPPVVLLGTSGSSGAKLEFVIDLEYVVTRLGFNTLPAEEYRVSESATNKLSERLESLELNYLVHVGGFTDKRIMSIEIDGNYESGLIRIPESNYNIRIDRNAPIKTAFYSGVKIEKIEGAGYRVDGYNLDSRFFNFLRPSTAGTQVGVEIGNTEVIKYLKWENNPVRIPYRTTFLKRQELYQFLLGLGKYYESIGFDNLDRWEQEAKLAVAWALDSDQTADFYANGISGSLFYHQGERGVLQQIDINYDGVSNVIDSNFKNIRRNELLVLRDEEKTEISMKSDVNRIFGVGIRVIEYEHIIALDNVTRFNDPIYQPALGLGQNRVRLVGERTRNWNGRFEAPGYLVRNNGLILNMESSVHELESEWVSAESKSLERLTRQTIGYNVGYSKPTYMTNLFIGDKSSYRFEKGARKYKGTAAAIKAMTHNKNIFGSEFTHEIYEEWMVRLGEYGDVSESRPLQFAIGPDQIKTDPQHFRFSKEFVSDKSEDLIIDLHTGANNAVSGNYDSPFAIYDVLRLDSASTRIQDLEQYQTFTRDAGLPLVTEIDYFLGSIDDIGDIYDPTQPYALIPNWSGTTSYVQEDQVRRFGKVYSLSTAATGLTNIQGDIIIRGTQIFPRPANNLTFIANGNTVAFSKFDTSVTYDNIILNGTIAMPTVPSGDRLVIDGINVDFNKTATTTTYSNIVLDGNVSNPDIINSSTRTLEIYYANAAAPVALSTVTVVFDQLDPNLTIQEIWLNALGGAITASSGSTVALTETNARIAAWEALRTAYIADQGIPAWQARVTAYYDNTGNPDLYLNPEIWGAQILANSGASWQAAAEALVQLDLDLIADIGASHSETLATMVSGTLVNSTTWAAALAAANNLLDFSITANNNNNNLQSYRGYAIANGSVVLNAGLEIAVAVPLNYVTDGLAAIASKIGAALIAASAPSGITVATTGNRITIARTANGDGDRLGVETDTDLGFTNADNDVQTQGTTSIGPVALVLQEIVNAINAFAITGVSAQAANNRLRIVSTNQQLVIGSGNANNDVGINPGTYNATANTTSVAVDLAIGDIVTQINTAGITDLVASQVEGALLLTYAGDQLIIGNGTANTELGVSANTYNSLTDEVSNTFNDNDWDIIQDPANFNIWTIDNIGSNPRGPVTTTNRYDVYQTLDFHIGVLEICAGAENGDDALVKCDIAHTMRAGEYVFIVNSTCIPSVDGIHLVTSLQGDTGFYIDRYIEQKGFTGKVLPLRSVRFPNTNAATVAMSNATYIQSGLGLRSGSYVYVDEVLDQNNNSLGYGAVYTVTRTIDGAGLVLVRNETGKTNNSTIKNGVLYRGETGETIIRYETYDPLKGIIPGIAAAELDIRSDVDFAYYTDSTDPDLETRDENAWGERQVGTVWWDLRNAVYLNYDQSSAAYRQAQWGQLFPTATIDVYEWTKSPVTPDEYINAVQGGTVIDGVELTGQPYAIQDQFGDTQYNWSEEMEFNRNTSQLETYYYFWVENKTTTPNIDREYSIQQIADIIIDPTSQAVDWIAATSSNTLLISNLGKSNGFQDLIMQVNYDANPSDYHQEFALLAENEPGLVIPEWLHISLRDSLAGFTQDVEIENYDAWVSNITYAPGRVVLSAQGKYYRCHIASTNNNPDADVNNNFWTLLEPQANNPNGIYTGVNTVSLRVPQAIPDPSLHPVVRYGIETRPHQTWFRDLDAARQAVVEKINSQLVNINLVDSDIAWRAEFERVFQVGGLEYDITQYWNFVDWNLAGFKFQQGEGDYFIDNVSKLALLSPSEGQIAQVERSTDLDGRSRRSAWRYTAGAWSQVYKEKATIRFNTLLWDSQAAQTGWDVVGWDTDEWDKSSSAVMVEIFGSFFNRIWIDEYKDFYADLWFHMAKYVLSEQLEPDWIFKSSYFKLIVEDTLEKRYNKFFTEGVDEFFDFVNTVKPFRSKMRDGIVRKVADDELLLAPQDALELRVQTNPANAVVDETATRSFRLSVGNNGLHYSSQIVNEHKVLLGIDIGPSNVIIPILNIGSGTLPSSSGAIWINGERITYTGVAFTDSSGIGQGFTTGFSAGFGGITLLTGVTRGTQGTFARKHAYADIVEDATNLELIENTILSGYGVTTTGLTDNLSPAWTEIGDGLLDSDNQDPNGITIRAEGFGTIDPYGNILHAQWVTLQESSSAIESFQNELQELIEDYLTLI